jgi:hypothetical protein
VVRGSFNADVVGKSVFSVMLLVVEDGLRGKGLREGDIRAE